MKIKNQVVTLPDGRSGIIRGIDTALKSILVYLVQTVSGLEKWPVSIIGE